MYGVVLLLHILAATIWTGGHLVLALSVLPKALRQQSPDELLRFEAAFEPVGMSALLIQVATGGWLAYRMVPEFSRWLSFDTPVSALIGTKLLLLALTVVLAADARLRIIPRLTPDHLAAMARRIGAVTVISVLFVIVGVSFRTGWFY